jgi:hemolysin activation/secretion protein
VRDLKVTGSTVFSAAELAQVTAPYVQRELTAEDLEEVRLALTRLYIEHGYVTSGAILPDQAVTDGVITLHIVEGVLSSIDIEGNKWFRSGYLRRRLALGAAPPVSVLALQERLQRLEQDERIARVNAELRPGVQLGESVLNVRVTENLPFQVALELNNYQSPTVGAVRGLMTVAHESLTGHGDILSAQIGYSSGTDFPQVDSSYAFPLTARDTTFILRYRRNNTVVIEEPFEDLDVVSESNIFGLTLRIPFYRTLRYEWALSLIGEHSQNKTFLLDDPFSFSPGVVDGKSTVTVVRVGLEWTDSTVNQVLALRSRVSVGVDILGATTHSNDNIPDGQFVAWLGQFQWTRRLTDWDLQSIFRLDVQLASQPLLPLEQIAVGGRYSVRGYRENQLVRDNGLIVSLESRLPIVRNKPWADFIQLVPFVDFGRAWNTTLDTPDPKLLVSIGIGLRWALTLTAPFLRQPQCEVYWGYPLQEVDTPGGDLQDLGLHLQFVIAAF